MDFGYSQDQQEIRRTARELLERRAAPERVREHAEARRPDEALWRELCELGWPGIAVSERYGGQGLGCVELSILCEELGRALAPVPYLPTVLAATLIEHAGSAEQRERLLPGLASGEQGAAVGVAREGRAELVVGGGEAHVFVLLNDGEDSASAGEGPARPGRGRGGAGEISARVLAAGEADIELVPSIDPTRSAARVTAGGQTGEPLQGEVAGALDRALVAVASELVGVCDRTLGMTVAYVKDRKQFGVPVGSYQAVSHRCAQMLLETEQARSIAAFGAWAADADPERLPEAAAMAKAAASEAAVHVTGSAIQAHGGIGFTWEADVHWLYKRAHVDAALLGSARRHRARLAAIVSPTVVASELTGAVRGGGFAAPIPT